MRFNRFLALLAVLPMMLLAAGCAKTAAQPDQPGAPGASGQPPAQTGTMGVITQCGADSITIAINPKGQNGQRETRPTGKPAGSAPQNTPEVSTSATPPAQDSTGWQTMTYAIDGDTKIVSTQTPASDGSGSTLTAADLKAGDNVSVTLRDGQTDVLDQITVLQGMGNGPGGPENPKATNAKS